MGKSVSVNESKILPVILEQKLTWSNVYYGMKRKGKSVKLFRHVLSFVFLVRHWSGFSAYCQSFSNKDPDWLVSISFIHFHLQVPGTGLERSGCSIIFPFARLVCFANKK